MLPDMHNEMSKETKEEVLARLRRRYATAGGEHKGKLLDQAVEVLGYHRKAAIRALGQQQLKKEPPRANVVLGSAQNVSPRDAAADLEADLVYSLSAVRQPATCALARMAAGI